VTRTWLRWIPAVAVPVVIAGGVLVGSLPASAGDPLPAKTPQQVLAMIAQHQEKSLSGTLEQTSELGLPELPKAGPEAGSPDTAWLELLSGPHTARVYLDGPENARIQVMDRLAERNAVKRGSELWFYNSKDNSAAHAQLPAGAAEHQQAAPGSVRTPEELADTLLAKLDETSEVAVGADVTVAGRAAYNLVLTPKSTVTLMASIAISVDGESGLPLGVEVKARGHSEPAFRVAFTSLSLDAPDASVFEFSPPPGATVKEIPVPKSNPEGSLPPSAEGRQPKTDGHSVTGTGWESVIELPSGAGLPGATSAGPPSADGELPSGSGAGALLEQAAVAVPGGKLLSTALVNVLILDDGRVFAGCVPLERLQSAAAKG
jgi:outer membrane lipoprotein-sorting protein